MNRTAIVNVASSQPISTPTHSSTAASARVVYFVASHVHPEQVIRLVRALRSGNPESRVLIHHDQNVSRLDPNSVTRLGGVEFLERPPVGWGTIRSVQMLLQAMQWSYDHYDFDFITYLSGQDYPVKPMVQIERELGALRGTVDAFIDADAVQDCTWHFGPERYVYAYYDLPRLRGLGRFRSWLQKRSNIFRHESERIGRSRSLPRLHVARDKYGARKVGMRPLIGPFANGALTIYAGSSWWTISRRAVKSILSFVESTPKMMKHYERVLFAPNESFFLTALVNSPELHIERKNNRRFVRWSRLETAHPDVLTSADIAELIGSGCDFARKIDGRVDGNLLDQLDRHQLMETEIKV